MEYERFFFFGNNKYAAKWNLLTGSSPVPQRYICSMGYANARKLEHFGSFSYKLPHSNTLGLYTYVILNIFEIPYSELSNFFILMCDDPNKSKPVPNDIFDMDFVNKFNSGNTITIPNVEIDADNSVMENNYLDGLDYLSIPTHNFSIAMNVLPCVESVDRVAHNIANTSEDVIMAEPSKESQIPSTSNTADRSNIKRKIAVPDNACTKFSKNLPDNSNQLEKNITLPSEAIVTSVQIINPQENMIVTSNENSNTILPIQEERFSFDAEVSNFVTPSINNLDLGRLNNELLQKLYNKDCDILGTRIEGIVELSPSNKIVFKSYDPIAEEVITTSPSIKFIEQANKMSESKTFYSLKNKSSLINGLLEPTTTGFLEFVKEHEANILAVVRSENDDEFLNNVNRTNNSCYGLLFGTYRYVKTRNPTLTAYMEIIACQTYGSASITAVSNALVKAYFYIVEPKDAPRITVNSVNFYHLQSINMANADVQICKTIMAEEDFKQNLRDIFQRNFTNCYVDILQDNQERIAYFKPDSSNFYMNLFAVDDFLQYVYTTYNVVLSPVNSRQGLKATADVLNDSFNNIFSIFYSRNYLGEV